MLLRTRCLALLLALPAIAQAQEDRIVVDLAGQKPGTTETRPVRPETALRIKVRNTVPTRAYAVDTERSFVPIPPLDPSVLSGAARGAPDICTEPEEALLAMLDGVSDEKEVGAKVTAANDGARVAGCSTDQLRALATAIEIHTTRTLEGIFYLSAGETLLVTVKRFDASGEVDDEWRIDATTGARGEWRIGYGFTFIPDEDEEFFSLEDENAPGNFVITEQRDSEELDFAPSIMFSWLSAKQRGKTWARGPTAGLGFDLDNPIVFAGYGFTYNENVTLTFGVVLHKQKRLDGRYAPGQTISENLDPDQLAEETYDGNVYFGLAFRFGSSPFGERGGTVGP